MMVKGDTQYCHSNHDCSDSDSCDDDGLTYRCIIMNQRSLGTCQCVGKHTHTHTHRNTISQINLLTRLLL